MDHLYPGVLEPMQEVIENLLTLPKKCRKAVKQPHRDSLLALTEKEEELKNLEKSLARQSAALKEKEQDLNERWDTGRIQDIPVGSILPPAGQLRRSCEAFSLYSLAESIRQNGILQPLTVRRVERTVTESTDRYELIAGERRLRAAAAIGMETVPCIVLETNRSRAAELALIENLQRENLNMFEHASAIASLMDIHAMTQEEIAKSLCCSQSAIANKLRILRLTEEERAVILSHQLSERHARTFLRIKNLDIRKKAVRYTAENRFNVAQTEAYVDALLSAPQDSEKSTFGTEMTCTSDGTVSFTDQPLQSSESVSAPHADSAGQNRKLILKDFRLFFNSVDRAVSVLREAGISVREEKEESENEIRIIISLPVTKSGQTPV